MPRASAVRASAASHRALACCKSSLPHAVSHSGAPFSYMARNCPRTAPGSGRVRRKSYSESTVAAARASVRARPYSAEKAQKSAWP